MRPSPSLGMKQTFKQYILMVQACMNPHVRVTHVYYMDTFMFTMHTCAHSIMHQCAYVHASTLMHSRDCKTHTHACSQGSTATHIHTCIIVCTCVHAFAYMHVYTSHMYTCLSLSGTICTLVLKYM